MSGWERGRARRGGAYDYVVSRVQSGELRVVRLLSKDYFFIIAISMIAGS